MKQNLLNNILNEDSLPLFDMQVDWEVVQTIIGSGYELDIAKLAIEDDIAKRAARKNMQIHSAVILKIGGEFAWFMTFQKNHPLCQLTCDPTPVSKFLPGCAPLRREALLMRRCSGLNSPEQANCCGQAFRWALAAKRQA